MSEPMSKERIAEIQARYKAYKKYCEKGMHSADCCVRETRKAMLRDNYSEYFANLAAHAPYDIPDLLTEIDRQAGEIERLKRDGQVVYATWEYPSYAPNGGSYVTEQCSRCGWSLPYSEENGSFKRSPFCPNCGAKMDKLPQGPEVEGV